jgi:RNA-binding protein
MKESEKAWLRSRGQLLEPIVRLGHSGVSAEFLAELNRCLDNAELVKIKFNNFKDQRRTLAPQIATATNSVLVGVVGHTALFFRQQPDPAKQRYLYESKKMAGPKPESAGNAPAPETPTSGNALDD